MNRVRMTLPDLDATIRRILTRHRTSPGNAAHVARGLVAAEADGQVGHGASRVPSYAAQAASGKVDGHATPSVAQVSRAGLRVDAATGFFYPAHALGLDALSALTREMGVAVAVICNSHHSGVAGHHVEPLAERGLIALSMGNGPQGIAPWGGTRGLFGTNPIAFAAPRRAGPPLVIDLSLSKVARGRVNVALQKGEAIPPDWALDAEGNPTTDPAAALEGTMLPMGDAKGAALALMVELMAGGLAGGNFGYEMSSFFTAEGGPPRNAQFLLAIDPAPFSRGTFLERLEDMAQAIAAQGARLPGTRRLGARETAAKDGVLLPAALHAQLLALEG